MSRNQNGIALTAQESADVGHCRLRHINPRNMQLLRNIEDNGVDDSGDATGGQICAVEKST